jgi:hypothetical protein
MDEDRDLAILAEEDEATLLAIDEGIRSADAGRLIPIEEVERLLPEWISKYYSTASGGVSRTEGSEAAAKIESTSLLPAPTSFAKTFICSRQLVSSVG